MKTALSTALLAAALPLQGADWPRFHGPGGRGTSDTTPGKAEFTGTDVAWECAVPGEGHGSPVVIEDTVFLTFATGGGFVLAAYSLAGGGQKWEHRWEITPHPHHQFNGMASATPCADRERVYTTWTSGTSRHAAALTHGGDLVWEREVGAYSEEHGSAASPVVVEGVLVVPNDCVGEGAILGLDPATGGEKWRHARAADKTSFSTPLELPDGGIAVAGTPYGITGIDVQTGEEKWQSEKLFDLRTVASPVLLGNRVFATAGAGAAGKQSLAFPIRDGVESFRITTALPYVPSGVSDGERLYLWGDGGVVHCVDANDGETLWRERASGPCYASPVLLGKMLLGCSKKGEVVTLEAGPGFKVLGRSDIGEPIYATPAFAGGKLILRTATRLLAVDLN